ncbi:YbfB/YjiJ family MFS transporter, partial [Kribbia dieselivorans]|uniref:YbfB/YjiJ family MFS transporter n=1 Tax=Kribbia dieselivorans TaxID=331526 RepID=UPI0008382F52
MLGLAAGPLIALGLARFAYALLLPPMREELHWTYSQAGALNTANAGGYLVGAVVAASLAGRIQTRRAFLLGCLVATLALFATPLTTSLPVLLVIRFLAGLGGAWALVLGGALVTAAGAGGSPKRAAIMLGLYYSGAGGGMTLAGVVVPWLLDRTDGAGWRPGWLALAVIAVAASIVAAWAATQAHEPEQPSHTDRGWRRGRIRWLTMSYTFYGTGYIVYLTFIVAYLAEHGLSPAAVSAFYVVLGVAAMVGGFAWAPTIGRLGGSKSMSVVLVALAVGTILPVVAPFGWSFVLSGILVGGSFLSVATAMSVGVRHILPPSLWTAALAFATTIFGFGQTAGPWVSGWVSDRFDDLGVGLIFAAVLLLLGALAALRQHEPL